MSKESSSHLLRDLGEYPVVSPPAEPVNDAGEPASQEARAVGRGMQSSPELALEPQPRKQLQELKEAFEQELQKNFSSEQRGSRKNRSWQSFKSENKLRGEPVSVVIEALQGALLKIALCNLGLTGDSQLNRWSKSLGRLGISSVQAPDLFELLDGDKLGYVGPEEILSVDIKKRMYNEYLTPSMTILEFLKLKYNLFLLGFRVGLDLMEKADLDISKLMRGFQHMGLFLDERDVERLLVALMSRQKLSWDPEMPKMQVMVVCHQLAIEGTRAATLDWNKLLLLRHRFLQAMFITVDADCSGSLDKGELAEALLHHGVPQRDAEDLFDDLVQSNCKENLPSDVAGSWESGRAVDNSELNLQDFSRAMSMAIDNTDLKALRSSSAKTAMSLVKSRRQLLLATLKHIEIDNHRVLDYEHWLGALERMTIDMETAGDIFVLLDVNHRCGVGITEVDQVLVGNGQLAQKQEFDGEISKEQYESFYNSWLYKNRHFSLDNEVRQLTLCEHLDKFVCGWKFQTGLCVFIAVHAVQLHLSADAAAQDQLVHQLCSIGEVVCFAAFFVEAMLKIIAWQRDYFMRTGCICDLLFIAITVVHWSLDLSAEDAMFLVFKILSIARVLRVLQIVPQLRLLKECLWVGVTNRRLQWTAASLLMLIWLYSMFIKTLLAPESEHWEYEEDICTLFNGVHAMDDYFGGVGRSMVTMMQVMTLDTWISVISRPVEVHRPYSWPFFFCFIILSNFAMLNMLKGFVLEQTIAFTNEDHKEEMERLRKDRQKQTNKLKALFEVANADESDELTVSEFQQIIRDPQVVAIFQSIGFEFDELYSLFTMLDVNSQGFVDLYEFTGGLMTLKREVKVADLIQLQQQHADQTKMLQHLIEEMNHFEDKLKTCGDAGRAVDEACDSISEVGGLNDPLSSRQGHRGRSPSNGDKHSLGKPNPERDNFIMAVDSFIDTKVSTWLQAECMQIDRRIQTLETYVRALMRQPSMDVQNFQVLDQMSALGKYDLS